MRQACRLHINSDGQEGNYQIEHSEDFLSIYFFIFWIMILVCCTKKTEGASHLISHPLKRWGGTHELQGAAQEACDLGTKFTSDAITKQIKNTLKFTSYIKYLLK